MFECISFIKKTLELTGLVAMAVSAVFMIATATGILLYVNQARGNGKDKGSLEFDMKKYGGSNGGE